MSSCTADFVIESIWHIWRLYYIRFRSVKTWIQSSDHAIALSLTLRWLKLDKFGRLVFSIQSPISGVGISGPTLEAGNPSGNTHMSSTVRIIGFKTIGHFIHRVDLKFPPQKGKRMLSAKLLLPDIDRTRRAISNFLNFRRGETTS